MPRGTPQRLIDRIVETNDRFNALIIKLEDRIERLEEDQSEVAAWKELFDRVENLEGIIDAVGAKINKTRITIDSY